MTRDTLPGSDRRINDWKSGFRSGLPPASAGSVLCLPYPNTCSISPPVGANQSQRPAPLGQCTVFNGFRCVLSQSAKNLIALPPVGLQCVAELCNQTVGIIVVEDGKRRDHPSTRPAR